MPHLITRWNYDFDAPEFISTDGVFWTLHLDKAQAFHTFEAACRALPIFNGRGIVTALSEAIKAEKSLLAKKRSR